MAFCHKPYAIFPQSQAQRHDYSALLRFLEIFTIKNRGFRLFSYSEIERFFIWLAFVFIKLRQAKMTTWEPFHRFSYTPARFIIMSQQEPKIPSMRKKTVFHRKSLNNVGFFRKQVGRTLADWVRWQGFGLSSQVKTTIGRHAFSAGGITPKGIHPPRRDERKIKQVEESRLASRRPIETAIRQTERTAKGHGGHGLR